MASTAGPAVGVVAEADKVDYGEKERIFSLMSQQGNVWLHSTCDLPTDRTLCVYGLMKPMPNEPSEPNSSSSASLYKMLGLSPDTELKTSAWYDVEFIGFEEAALRNLQWTRKAVLVGFTIGNPVENVRFVPDIHLQLKADKAEVRVWLLDSFVSELESPVSSSKYTVLNCLYVAKQLFIYAAIKSFSYVGKGDGTVSLRMKLVDGTIPFEEPVPCYIKYPSRRHVPQLSTENINVIRLHRISCSNEEGSYVLYGCINNLGLATEFWSTVGGRSPTRLPCQHKNCATSPTEAGEVQCLCNLLLMESELSSREDRANEFSTISTCSPGKYLNMIAQVVAVYPSTMLRNCFIIRSMDGTLPPDNLVFVPIEQEQPSSASQPERGFSYLFDIFAYDEHAEVARSLEPGTYAAFFNLHCYYKYTFRKTMSLTMHTGRVNGRRIEVLPSDDPIVENVQNRIAAALVQHE